MKKIITLMMLMLFLTACGADETPTPTPEMSAGEAAVQLIQEDMKLRLTQQSIEAARLETSARMTATQQVMDATATEQRHVENIQATRQAAAATQRVWDVTVQAGYAQDTETAVARAAATQQAEQAHGTEVALGYLHGTSTAQIQATERTVKATQDQASWSAQATAQYAQAESAKFAADRERMTNGVMAWGPWIIALVAMGVAAFAIIRKSQVGTVERDENGMMPGVMVFHKGQKMFISPDRMFAPVLNFGRQGVTAPQLVDSERQEGATRRAQAVEAINALPPQAQRQGMGLMSQTFNEVTSKRIEVVGQEQLTGWLDEAETKLSEEI